MDEQAARRFEAAWDAHGAAVYRLAMVYLGRAADAEDVTQEVFCRLLDRAPDFADREHQRRWLFQVTANLCRDQLRGFWRRRAAALESDLPAQAPEDRGYGRRCWPCRRPTGPPSICITTRASPYRRWPPCCA